MVNKSRQQHQNNKKRKAKARDQQKVDRIIADTKLRMRHADRVRRAQEGNRFGGLNMAHSAAQLFGGPTHRSPEPDQREATERLLCSLFGETYQP